jgi:hypothetical protein
MALGGVGELGPRATAAVPGSYGGAKQQVQVVGCGSEGVDEGQRAQPAWTMPRLRCAAGVVAGW